jgi:hypothetical protein
MRYWYNNGDVNNNNFNTTVSSGAWNYYDQATGTYKDGYTHYIG